MGEAVARVKAVEPATNDRRDRFRGNWERQEMVFITAVIVADEGCFAP